MICKHNTTLSPSPISYRFAPFNLENRSKNPPACRTGDFLSYHEHEGCGGLPVAQNPNEHDVIGREEGRRCMSRLQFIIWRIDEGRANI